MNASQVHRNKDDLELYSKAFDDNDAVTMRSIECRHGCYGLVPERVIVKLFQDVEYCRERYLKDYLI